MHRCLYSWNLWSEMCISCHIIVLMWKVTLLKKDQVAPEKFKLYIQDRKNNAIIIVGVLSHFTHVQLFVTLQTIAWQAPLSTGYSRQEYRSWLPGPPPGDLPKSGIEPTSLTTPALAFYHGLFTTSATWEAPIIVGQCPIFF